MRSPTLRLVLRGPLVILLIALSPAASSAQTPKPEESSGTALTIYSTARPGAVPPDLYRPLPSGGSVGGYGQQVPGYAVVKQEREINLAADRSTIQFTDVAALIDPTTVKFVSLTDPEGTQVVEQSYQFDLVSTEKLMQRYIDRDVTLEQSAGNGVRTFSGKLLSTAGGVVLQTPTGGVQVLTNYANATFPELPGGLITRPTLVWDIAAKKPGAQRVRVAYQTSGITWWADYNLVFAEGKNANEGAVDVSAWVSILNQSGGTYSDARLKLVAGDVHRVTRLEPMALGEARMKSAMAPSGFEEKPFFEYHLYTLGRRTSIPDSSTKQIELFPAVRAVPAEKVLVYYGLPERFPAVFADPLTDRTIGASSNKKVDIYLRFRNVKDVGLGIPLPSGRVRVSKVDPADGSLEFIGEDTIDHTPKDEPVLIQLGSAFDVVGERKQLDFKVDQAARRMEEQIEITLRNHKEKPVKVIAKENLYRWANWEIVQKSHDFEKVDARTIDFPVTVPANGQTSVRYTVRYTW